MSENSSQNTTIFKRGDYVIFPTGGIYIVKHVHETKYNLKRINGYSSVYHHEFVEHNARLATEKEVKAYKAKLL